MADEPPTPLEILKNVVKFIKTSKDTLMTLDPEVQAVIQNKIKRVLGIIVGRVPRNNNGRIPKPYGGAIRLLVQYKKAIDTLFSLQGINADEYTYTTVERLIDEIVRMGDSMILFAEGGKTNKEKLDYIAAKKKYIQHLESYFYSPTEGGRRTRRKRQQKRQTRRR